jgi:hypothetical protein
LAFACQKLSLQFQQYHTENRARILMVSKKKKKIVILGSMCRLPVPGVVFQILHYMLGFEQLGFESYFVEWHGNWISNPVDRSDSPDEPRLIIGDVMKEFGFDGRWICRGDQIAPGYTFGGMSKERLSKLYSEAEAIINVTGAHFIEKDQLQCPRRVYLETDPGIPQIRLEKGDTKMQSLVKGHTHHLTFGENMYNPDCLLPKSSLKYRPTRQPVVLDLWKSEVNTDCKKFTTVARWMKQKNKSIKFGGEIYQWNKNLEFMKLLDLPELSGEKLELALSALNHEDRIQLEQCGWDVVDAMSECLSLNDYRQYIHDSRGEITIAKDQYVRLLTGWFSDRSACYLASGKPVITQDTGFGSSLPTGEGLFTFQTMEDILTALDTINSDYHKHCRAAQEIAREYFDARKVLGELLEFIEVDYEAKG